MNEAAFADSAIGHDDDILTGNFKSSEITFYLFYLWR